MRFLLLRGCLVAEPFNFRVVAAGTPKMCNAGSKRQPVIMLTGHSRAHYGVIVGGPSCRLVADPASPLKFSGIGEILPMPRREVNEAERDGERWVVLHSVGLFQSWPKDLFGMQVRIEYALPEVTRV